MDRSDVDVVEKKPPSPFPVSDLLSGIYRLIQVLLKILFSISL